MVGRSRLIPEKVALPHPGRANKGDAKEGEIWQTRL